MSGKTGTTQGRRRVDFHLESGAGREVFLAGTFNGWDAARKQLSDSGSAGFYCGSLLLPKGRYEYKFVVDGEWSIDPENSEFVVNDRGTLNSVLIVE